MNGPLVAARAGATEPKAMIMVVTNTMMKTAALFLIAIILALPYDVVGEKHAVSNGLPASSYATTTRNIIDSRNE